MGEGGEEEEAAGGGGGEETCWKEFVMFYGRKVVMLLR